MGALMLVHGVGHGAWCWSRTRADLVGRGHDVFAVDLPLTGLDDDAATLQRALDEWGRETVLVGHSYAGLVPSCPHHRRGRAHPGWQLRCPGRGGHRVVTLDTDHSPFMSSPEAFADLLDGIPNNANDDVRSTC